MIAQKQQGLYAVYYHPLGGCLAPQKLCQIYETIKDMEDVELRITPQQGVYIINCTADEAKAVLAITEDGARNRFEESVSCIGASICQVGLRDSQGTLREAIMYFREKTILQMSYRVSLSPVAPALVEPIKSELLVFRVQSR